MKLSKASAHAALALSFLASRTAKGPTQARQVAQYLNIPTDSALKILHTLSRGGFVQSQLGRSGGYRLCRPPEAISLLDIVEAVDGQISARIPLYDRDRLGARVDLLESMCQQAAVGLRAELARYSIADLADQPVEAETAAS